MEWALIILLSGKVAAGPIVIDGFKDSESCNFSREQMVYELNQLPGVLAREDLSNCFHVRKEKQDSPPQKIDNPGGGFAD